MSEHHILNPRVGWDDLIQDNICPDYGFDRKWPETGASGKAPGGRPFYRELTNDGHTFSLSWLNRSYPCVQKIRQFYHQYKRGYFTLIDRDGGGRHYVGHFVGDFPDHLNGNDSWDIRELQFVEVPGVPMLQYPSDWLRDSVTLYPFDDFGAQIAGTGQGNWHQRTDRPGPPCFAGGGNAGDFFCMEYRGYGFQLWMLTGPLEGTVEVSVDGALQATVDLNHPGNTIGPAMVYSQAELPLDLHRVKVATTGAHNNSGVTFFYLQVMR